MAAEVLVILLFAAVLLRSPVLKPAARWRPLVFFGKISYSVFLLHTTVIFLIFRYVLIDLRPQLTGLEGVSAWTAFVIYGLVALAITTLVSYMSFRFIESPFLRRKPK
jgi:peptidoglycan/LPS O-acetylase OafA/YrhL